MRAFKLATMRLPISMRNFCKSYIPLTNARISVAIIRSFRLLGTLATPNNVAIIVNKLDHIHLARRLVGHSTVTAGQALVFADPHRWGQVVVYP
jgi:hypothetical protein